MRSRITRTRLAAAGALFAAASSTAWAQPTLPAQSSGLDGCISQDGQWNCQPSTALYGAFGLALSKDGKNAYVASIDSNTIAVLARDRTTGGLTQLSGTQGCVSETGSNGQCADGVGLLNPISVAVSPDNKHVYVASFQRDPVSVSAIAVFARDKQTGALTQLDGLDGCLSDDGTNGYCTKATAVRGTQAITVSNDGKHVYVASYQSSAVAAFARDKDTGKLTQLAGQGACVSEDGTGGLCADGHALSGPQAVVVSKDGKRVYVATYRSESVVTLIRDRTTGALTQPTGTEWCISDDGTGGLCTDGVATTGATTMALSPNGKALYVTSPATSAVAVLMRERRTGTLSQAPAPYGCISDDGSNGACTDGDALRNVYGVAVAPDGKSFYVAGRDHDALTVIGRDEKTGVLTQAPSPWGCISEDGYGGLCTDGRVLRTPRGVAVSSDGKHVYVAAQGSHGVAVLQREP